MRKSLLSASIALLVILILSGYCNTFSSPPILDDFHSFVREPSIYLENLSLENLISVSDSTFGRTRLVPMLTFAVDYYLGDGAIFYFHLTNILIHLFCMLAVIFLTLQLMKASRSSEIGSPGMPPVYFAIWVAGLWALNPVQTNAVTYLVQRMASIQALFYVVSVCFYLKGRFEHTGAGKLRAAFPYYLLCFFSGILAFLSKPNSAMLPVMLVVTELWFFNPDLIRDLWNAFKRSKWPSRVLFLVVLLIASIYFYKLFLRMAGGYGVRNFTMVERLLTESRVVVWYISLLLWPSPSRLSMEHDVIISKTLLSPPTTLFSYIFLLLLAFLILRFRRRLPLATYGGMWFFLNLAIESTIVPLELVFEHRLYLPSVGFYLSLVIILVLIAGHARRRLSQTDFVKISWSFFAILMSGLTLMTFQRNEAWRDILTINQDAVSKAPNHHRSHANYAVALLRAGRFEESIKEAELAIQLGQPHFESYMVASNAIVGALAGLGELEQATNRGEELLAAAPKTLDAGAFPIFCLQTAETYRRLGQLSKAYQTSMKSLRSNRISAYQMMLLEQLVARIASEAKDKDIDLNNDGARDPGELPIGAWTARQFLKAEKRTAAEKVLEQALLENPDHDETLRMLQGLRREDRLNREQAAKGDFVKGYVHSPFSRFNMTMALAYLVRKHNLPAPFSLLGLAWINEAVEMRPGVPEAHLLKSWYYYWMGNTGQALASANAALELDPDYAKAWFARGLFLGSRNEPEQALAAFNKCLELYPGNPQRKNIVDLMAGLHAGTLADNSNVGYEFRKN